MKLTPKPSSNVRVKTVLVAEDQEDNRFIVCAYLSHQGYRTIEAENGAAALTLARADRPDLVIMDVSMPVMDGIEATRALKSDPDLRAIPIIMLSAHAMASDEAHGAAAGSDAYLTKPIEPAAVYAEVMRWIGPPSGDGRPVA